MITFTKEQLIASALARIDFAEMMLAGELEPLKERTWSIELELARIELASLEAEAVGYFGRFDADDEDLIDQCGPNISGAFPLYTAPPAPVSVPEDEQYKPHPVMAVKGELRFLDHFDLIISERDEDIDIGQLGSSNYEALMPAALDAFRAAMLQGADGNLTNEVTMPANTPCKEAPEHIWLQTAGVWPENGEFGELTWCSDNQHDDDTLYVRADVASGNSPVVPDGWVMVPIEPTEHMIVEGFESEPDEFFSDEEVWEAYDTMSGCQQAAHRAKLCWAAMIKSSPKLE